MLEDDVFGAAAKDSIIKSKGTKTVVGDRIKVSDTKNHKPPRKRRTNAEIAKKGEMLIKQWDSLKNDVVGSHSERFNAILDSLTDKEFVKVYLNILEYFKPKVTRVESVTNPTKNTTINITINRGNKEKTIDVTPEKED